MDLDAVISNTGPLPTTKDSNEVDEDVEMEAVVITWISETFSCAEVAFGVNTTAVRVRVPVFARKSEQEASVSVADGMMKVRVMKLTEAPSMEKTEIVKVEDQVTSFVTPVVVNRSAGMTEMSVEESVKEVSVCSDICVPSKRMREAVETC